MLNGAVFLGGIGHGFHGLAFVALESTKPPIVPAQATAGIDDKTDGVRAAARIPFVAQSCFAEGEVRAGEACSLPGFFLAIFKSSFLYHSWTRMSRHIPIP